MRGWYEAPPQCVSALPRLRGEGATAVPLGSKSPNSAAGSEVLAGRTCPNMRAGDGPQGFPVATRRSMMMTGLAMRHDEPMRAGRAKTSFATDESRWEAVKRRDRA